MTTGQMCGDVVHGVRHQMNYLSSDETVLPMEMVYKAARFVQCVGSQRNMLVTVDAQTNQERSFINSSRNLIQSDRANAMTVSRAKAYYSAAHGNKYSDDYAYGSMEECVRELYSIHMVSVGYLDDGR
jgi:hypothetical protein